MKERYLYSELASLVEARMNCIDKIIENPHSPMVLEWKEWAGKHMFNAFDLVNKYMPSGSGFDAGTALDLERSHAEKLVFTTSFHHMDEHGFYDGWTTHEVIVTPSLMFGFRLRVTGRNRNDIKEYITDVFSNALRTVVGEEE